LLTNAIQRSSGYFQLEVPQIKLLLKHSDICEVGSLYNELMGKIFDNAPLLRKVDMSVNSLVDVIKKCPSEVQELKLRFVEAKWKNAEKEDQHVVDVFQTALELTKLKKLTVNHMTTLSTKELKLYSASITSLNIENAKHIQIKELRFPSLKHLNWEDRFWAYYIFDYSYGGSKQDYLKPIYECCPQLESLNDVTLHFSREIGVEEWIKSCKSSLKEKLYARRPLIR